MASKAYTLVMEERKKLTETIISNLEKNGLDWVKGWSSKFAPHNATTEKAYRGGNKLKLMITADQRGYDDPRWVTFNQAKEKGWQVKKGSKSVALEKWIFSKKEIDKITKIETIVKLKNPIVNYFRVFNANDIEGIPEQIQEIELEKTNEELNDLISNLKRSSECEIREEKQDRAYYSSLQDHIVLPPQEAFVSQEQYLGTLLHEMGHSTGHSDRLNRPLGNGFGSVDYAKEELRAEISAIFSQKELGIDLKTEHIDNHSAYLNSWIQVLKNDPNEIYKASSDSEKIADRIIENYQNLKLEKENSFMKETALKLESIGVNHQIIHNEGTYPFQNQEWRKLHEDYTNVTGIKVKLGEDLGNNRSLYCLDIDCKGQDKQGKELLDLVLDKMPKLKDTYIEKTKSNGYHVFLFSDQKTYEKISKIIFTEPYVKDIETNPLEKKLEIEFFCDNGVTIAPTTTNKGSYTALNENPIQILELEEIQELLKELRDNSNSMDILEKGGNNTFKSDFSIEDKESLAAIKLLKENNIKHQVKNGKVQIWTNSDKSKNGDYILNPHKILWNLKTFERIKVAKFIIRENGNLIEGKQIEKPKKTLLQKKRAASKER